MYNKNPMGLLTEFMRRYFAAIGQTSAAPVDPEAWKQMAEEMARKLTEAASTEASEFTPPKTRTNEADEQADDNRGRGAHEIRTTCGCQRKSPVWIDRHYRSPGSRC